MAYPNASRRGGAVADMQSRAEQTRTRLLSAARELFSEPGYHATGTPTVAARAGVTRGALYHHFKGKQELFEAVFCEVSAELNQITRDAAHQVEGSLWEQIVQAFTVYLQTVAASVTIQRILLIDAPTVLGWQRWRELQYEFVANRVVAALDKLMADNIIPGHPAQPLAWLIQAALSDAALSIAHADDKQKAADDAKNAFLFLLQGLTRQPLQPFSE